MIIVTSFTGAGRTTIITLIANALKNANIEYDIESADCPPLYDDPELFEKARNMVAENTKVTIKDIQANRHGFDQ